MKEWLSTTGIALLLCLLGCSSLLLPWAQAIVLTVDPVPQADGSYKVKAWVTESYAGYRFWHASACALTFLGLFLFLLVVGPIRPIPWWRSATLLVCATSIIAVVLAGLNYQYGVVESDSERGRLVNSNWGIVNYLVMGLAAGLMLLAALELRSRIAGRYGEQMKAGQKQPGTDIA
jgi:hypothetical protein